MDAILGRLRSVSVLAVLAVIPLAFWPRSRDTFNFVKEAGLACYGAPAFAAWILAGLPGAAAVPRWYACACAGLCLWTLARIPGCSDLASAFLHTGELLLALVSAACALGLPETAQRRAPAFLAAGAALASAAAIVQGLTGWRMFVLDPESVTFTADRVSSTFGNPVCFAGYLILVIPLTFAEAFGPGGERGSGGNRAFFVAALALELAAVILTASRGAMLGLGAAAIAYSLAVRGTLRRALMPAACFALAIAAAGIWRPGAAVHLLTASDPGRAFIWRAALRAWASAPVAGIGPGQFAHRYPCVRQGIRRLETGVFRGNAIYAHNEYLQAGAELGVPGILLVVAVLGGILFLPAPPRAAPSAPPRAGPAAVKAGLLAVAVQALFSFPLHVAPMQAFVWTLPALWLIAGRGPAPGREREVARRSWHAPALLAVCLASAAIMCRPIVRSAYFHEALVLKNDGNFRESGACFGRALALIPDTARERIVFHRAEMLFKSGDLAASQRAFEEDMALFPCNPDGYGYLAFIHLMRAVNGQTQELEKARSMVEKALAFRPAGRKAAKCLNIQGNVRAMEGNLTGALASYRAALLCDGTSGEASVNLSRLLERMGRHREAARVAREAANRGKTAAKVSAGP